jgi:uncharacterized protein involved in response to NO
MQLISIDEIAKPSRSLAKQAFLHLGFRPFFLLASGFFILSLSAWMLYYTHTVTIQFNHITPSQWHAHEMLFGYAFAIVAGFLLTAVKNWTGIQTLHGKPLLLLVSFWLIARLIQVFYTKAVILAATFDLSFNLYLACAIAYPIIQAKQWKQLGILSKIGLLTLGNALFYSAELGWYAQGAFIGNTLALFMIISLILVIGRRVVPMFIQNGLQLKTPLAQSKPVDIGIMLGLVVMLVNELFLHISLVTMIISSLLFGLNAFRLIRWHHIGIWTKPLLWSLYIGLWLICLGFLIFALSAISPKVLPIFAIHLWAIGGIALMTLSMMSRVSLGHTGRDINQPPSSLTYLFSLIVLGALLRAVAPIFLPQYYLAWVLATYVVCVLGFVLFIFSYSKILIKPRVDGKFG